MKYAIEEIDVTNECDHCVSIIRQNDHASTIFQLKTEVENHELLFLRKIFIY